jgi:hypothetical protein
MLEKVITVEESYPVMVGAGNPPAERLTIVGACVEYRVIKKSPSIPEYPAICISIIVLIPEVALLLFKAMTI